MGLAWATIALVLFLLPGFLFHLGVTFPEDFTRENVKREQLGQLTGAVLVAFIVHAGLLVFLDGLVLHTGWSWPVVDLDACLLAEGRECTSCIQQCPYEAISVLTSADGFSTEPFVELEKCTGCGACEAVCPVRPVRAIRVGTQQSISH